ncbi:uncharacterized protein LOC116205940 [Punica granatum]|uniref:Uncharacterized protein n=2 Tax=Punica granatum TaxID=22663 RepID=A0A2I0KYG9_PUNGR|nr:uncharacterized protein LOC116205940 [Punica granatum]PKI73521.1 hypothetical protein CRG98_006102 [Punica granatum]
MDGHHPSRIEAERLLGVAEKLLLARDLNGSKEFALLAQETEPLLEGSDQILAIVDVLLAAERRVNNHHDWYSILQIDRRTDDQELIKRQYRRLALLLHPDKNKYPYADHAFRFVAASWAVLSDPSKKTVFDRELSFFSRVDLSAAAAAAQQVKLPVRRTGPVAGAFAEVARAHTGERPPPPQPQPPQEPAVGDDGGGDRSRFATFWTTCPYCYYLHEYPAMYENCCLRCQECHRAFHGAPITSPPPQLPGKDAYHFCWGAFPLGFVVTKTEPKVVPKPPAAASKSASAQKKAGGRGSGARRAAAPAAPGPNGPRKRGRPRKYA